MFWCVVDMHHACHMMQQWMDLLSGTNGNVFCGAGFGQSATPAFGAPATPGFGSPGAPGFGAPASPAAPFGTPASASSFGGGFAAAASQSGEQRPVIKVIFLTYKASVEQLQVPSQPPRVYIATIAGRTMRLPTNYRLSCSSLHQRRISRDLSRYSPMSEVFAPRYLAGLVSTHG